MNGVVSRIFSALWGTVKIICNVVSRLYEGRRRHQWSCWFSSSTKMWLWKTVTTIENELNFQNAVEIIIMPQENSHLSMIYAIKHEICYKAWNRLLSMIYAITHEICYKAWYRLFIMIYAIKHKIGYKTWYRVLSMIYAITHEICYKAWYRLLSMIYAIKHEICYKAW